jgi:dimethylhistidine N-methyltransferase
MSAGPKRAVPQGYIRIEHSGDVPQLADDLRDGFARRPRRLSARFFYDDEGSRLFQEITRLPEYYPTRVEAQILRDCAPDVADRIGATSVNLVDLGAGDGHKTELLLPALIGRGAAVRYVPMDISESALSGLVESIGGRFPELEIGGVLAEYADGLRWLSTQSSRRNLVLFLGSNIGNFEPPGDVAFLTQLREALNPGDLLFIGFDLWKDVGTMVAAYDDSQGVTARFNLNLLTRINRELGGDFDRDGFRHEAGWDAERGTMFSHLVSVRRQTVSIAAVGESYDFDVGDRIHTEDSFKYTAARIAEMAAASGFVPVREYLDDRGWFCDALWRVGP